MQFAVEHAEGLFLRYDAPSPIMADINHCIWYGKKPSQVVAARAGEGII